MTGNNADHPERIQNLVPKEESNMNTLTQKILKEFDEKFICDDDWNNELYQFVPSGTVKANGKVKAFLSSALDEQRRLICEEVKRLKPLLNGANPHRKSFGEGEYNAEQETWCRVGALTILADVLSLLQKESEEEGE